jgi:tight adherence protein B
VVEAALALMLLTGIGLIVAAWQRARALAAAESIISGDDVAVEGPNSSLGLRPYARRHHFAPWGFAIAVGTVLLFGLGLPWPFAATLAFVSGLLGSLADAWRSQWMLNRIESQLADAIGLMIGAVGVGASLQSALENAVLESRNPLRPILESVAGRIRFGDDPQTVMVALRELVPLETFRLFATTMAVNWQVGGSLAPTLAKVERTVRDRIETNRRIQAMTTQTRVSVLGILFVTYFIAALVWRNNPERMAGFLRVPVGQAMAAGAIGLQGLGIVWISWMSRPRF